MTGLKDKRDYDPAGMRCIFCQKLSHTRSFCPLRPTEPAEEDKNPFVEQILSLPRVKLADKIPQTTTSLEKFLAEGTAYNVNNPWRNSDQRSDLLRGRLGYWKA
jgi:hypothetical protein